MTDFKAELRLAREKNDWTRADQLFRELCQIVKIEEESAGGGISEAKEIAAKHNRELAGESDGGIKI